MERNDDVKGDESVQNRSLNLTVYTVKSKDSALNWQESHRRAH